MSAQFELNAAPRGDAGKGASRRLRHQGLVPAILYGNETVPLSISLSHRELTKALENEAFFSRIVTIKMDGADLPVIIKDLQRHPAKPVIMHADFLRVSMDRKINVHIPLHFINQDKCDAFRQGAVLEIVRHAVEVKVRADHIPEDLIVDLAGHKMGDTIRWADLKAPKDVAPVITDRDFVIALIKSSSAAVSAASDGSDAEGSAEG